MVIIRLWHLIRPIPMTREASNFSTRDSESRRLLLCTREFWPRHILVTFFEVIGLGGLGASVFTGSGRETFGCRLPRDANLAVRTTTNNNTTCMYIYIYIYIYIYNYIHNIYIYTYIYIYIYGVLRTPDSRGGGILATRGFDPSRLLFLRGGFSSTVNFQTKNL